MANNLMMIIQAEFGDYKPTPVLCQTTSPCSCPLAVIKQTPKSTDVGQSNCSLQLLLTHACLGGEDSVFVAVDRVFSLYSL